MCCWLVLRVCVCVPVFCRPLLLTPVPPVVFVFRARPPVLGGACHIRVGTPDTASSFNKVKQQQQQKKTGKKQKQKCLAPHTTTGAC